MPSEPPDVDLLEPTLDPGFDRLAFDQPFSPWGLLFPVFFGGPVTAGILFATNFKRLGDPRAARLCLIGFGGLMLLVVAGIVGWAHAEGIDLVTDLEQKQMARLIQQAAGLVAGTWMASRQQKAYRIFEHTGREPGKLLRPAIVAILLGWTATFVLFFSAAMILR